MENYEVLGPLGKGSFGTVSKVQRKADRKVFVWKEINYRSMNEKEKQQLVAEVNILRSLSHPHIVRYHDRLLDKARHTLYIVMEFCAGGDLARFLAQQKRQQTPVAEEFIWKVLLQVSLALLSCHRREAGRIIHRDIKPGNIFLDQTLNVKLGDFGLSRIMGEQSEYAQTRVGTPYYMSPEQVTEARYNEQSDIWSLGCLIYEMAALRPPFQAHNHMALALKIKEGRVERFSERYSEDLWRLVQDMLNVDFTQRPNIEALLDYPVLAQKRSEKLLRDEIQTLKLKEEELARTKERLDKLQADLARREEEVKQKEEKLATRKERPPLVPREESEVLQLRPVRALSPADQRQLRTQSPVLVHTGIMVLNRPRSALTPVGQEASLETITRTILERRNRLALQ